MKKQLGLLTLGMALCLVVPVIGQATGKGPDSKATITIENDIKKQERIIHGSPDFNFGTLEMDTSVSTNTIRTNSSGSLEVENKDGGQGWEVGVEADEFTNNGQTLNYESFSIPLNSNGVSGDPGEHQMPEPNGTINVKTGGRILVSKDGAVGTFNYEMEQAELAVFSNQQAEGLYTANLTWRMGDYVK